MPAWMKCVSVGVAQPAAFDLQKGNAAQHAVWVGHVVECIGVRHRPHSTICSCGCGSSAGIR